MSGGEGASIRAQGDGLSVGEAPSVVPRLEGGVHPNRSSDEHSRSPMNAACTVPQTLSSARGRDRQGRKGREVLNRNGTRQFVTSQICNQRIDVYADGGVLPGRSS